MNPDFKKNPIYLGTLSRPNSTVPRKSSDENLSLSQTCDITGSGDGVIFLWNMSHLRNRKRYYAQNMCMKLQSDPLMRLCYKAVTLYKAVTFTLHEWKLYSNYKVKLKYEATPSVKRSLFHSTKGGRFRRFDCVT